MTYVTLQTAIASNVFSLAFGFLSALVWKAMTDKGGCK